MDTRLWMSVLLFIATALMIFVTVLSYRKRHLPVARTMILIMLAAIFYSVGYAFEVLSLSLYDVKLALQIEYLGIPFISTLWLFQVIQFTGTAVRYRKRLALVLFIVPFVIFFLHLTNDWHHLVYERYMRNADASVPLYLTVKGPGYMLHTAYNYFVLLCGILLFIPMYWQALPIVRKQIIILLLGAIAPMLLNLLLWSGMNVDLTPFGFAVSGLAYAWGILRFNLLRLTPLALAKVFQTIRDGVLLLDYENEIVSYNRAAEEVLPELLRTKRYPADMGAVLSDCPELIERIRAASDGDERFAFHRFDGSRNKHYNCSLSFIYDSGEVPIGKMLMFNDITELKENEARLRENARQLSELNAFKDKLFTVVAHDIRDPIALLVSLTELLGEELTAADYEHAELVRELQGQVQSTFHLVENLLDWYRGQKGKVVFRPSGWNLQQVVRQALSLAAAKAGMKQIRMTERIDDMLTVSADKEMLDLILRNLISNAIKFTGIGGVIEIGAALEGDRVMVSVRDNGSGIDEKTSEMLRLEEPFFKFQSTGDDSGDTRFGLVLTREFIRIHGGSLWFDSLPGIGTTFFFTLPGSAGGRIAFDYGEAEAGIG
ncbi:sensor histidine kinase [Paenibacillus nasutitermitis]|uniref:histidine kinase n=1 Tax=Paenibacillus nasutitermitis TaxID=1652958 RepID=A0A916ZDG8_9BACL|nr:histidine kinase N-terminal 7TM domain-containing protein [Paenibacillus nasutitermitis]GGD89052.1 two-component sensor histidine kinase [Paenibacillus nasutitermitis]